MAADLPGVHGIASGPDSRRPQSEAVFVRSVSLPMPGVTDGSIRIPDDGAGAFPFDESERHPGRGTSRLADDGSMPLQRDSRVAVSRLTSTSSGEIPDG